MLGNSPGYQYLIVGIAIAVLCALVIHFGRMKKRKQAAISESRMNVYLTQQRRWGAPRVRAQSRTTPTRTSLNSSLSARITPEGLNEVGEAPPAYTPTSKPPSLMHVEDAINGIPENTAVDRMERGLPKYEEAITNDGRSSIQQPPAAMLSDRSLRRLVDDTETSSWR